MIMQIYVLKTMFLPNCPQLYLFFSFKLFLTCKLNLCFFFFFFSLQNISNLQTIPVAMGLLLWAYLPGANGGLKGSSFCVGLFGRHCG